MGPTVSLAVGGPSWWDLNPVVHACSCPWVVLVLCVCMCVSCCNTAYMQHQTVIWL